MGRLKGHIDASRGVRLLDTSWAQSAQLYREFRDSPDAPAITPRVARVMVEEAIIVANKEASCHGNTGHRIVVPRYAATLKAERDYLRLIVYGAKERMRLRQLAA